MGRSKVFGVLAAVTLTTLIMLGCGGDAGDGHTHTWDDWTVTSPATCDAAGVEVGVYTKDAGHTETRLTPQLSGTAYVDVGRTVQIGGLTWMAENLNINTANSWCYGEGGPVYDSGSGNFITLSSAEVQANCDKYGRLYTWDAAMSACPSGWRLPTREDWDNLVAAVGGNLGAGTKLKASAPDWDGTNDFGFSALPGGGRFTGGDFFSAGTNGYWWSATEYGIGHAGFRYMRTGYDYVIEFTYGKAGGLSVRCVH